ncbi:MULTISPECIES: MbtH family NRPS accessory protein [unclassified Streptomyces]|uniref:MbtH family protein n=1 Tax=unclassified Streptomyces TaxID=2593676 RepID=UPI00224C80C1|nr:MULTISPECIES: MbtH family NRPS accessory protein [unclassified Streptomyces]MCX4992718.1 MbtH family NRPS accessory protein [Streptomyces sp. NBC_00568]MCX5002045.1 MbtH family NRPS accessory protein [Streptomyces sp. NBC_00638]
MADEQTDDRVYRVVLNDEEQYSIWAADRDLPAGWHAEGTEGTRQECLDRIEEVWTDLRPASLRRRMEQTSA